MDGQQANETASSFKQCKVLGLYKKRKANISKNILALFENILQLPGKMKYQE